MSGDIERFIREMPKVELHVHLEGSTRPETFLALARRHKVDLPADDLEGLKRWYEFTSFDHFIEVYGAIAECLSTAEDIELIAREFLTGQAEQHILYSEVTYTPFSQYVRHGIPFDEQLAAINSARSWAERKFGVRMGMVIDIPRMIDAELGLVSAEWAISAMDRGVVAFGLGGPEVGNPPEKFKKSFDAARAAGLPSVPHAGETAGPESIWGALKVLNADRLGHGVRCLEDPGLVQYLREKQIPLEVCPGSNVCLKVYPDLASHPLPKLIREGLYVTINSDDPPFFNTTLTDEYLRAARTFHWDEGWIRQIALNGLNASFLPPDEKGRLREKMMTFMPAEESGR
jgi:adenosine deaminase